MKRPALLLCFLCALVSLMVASRAEATNQTDPAKSEKSGCEGMPLKPQQGPKRSALLIGNAAYDRKLNDVSGSLLRLITPVQDVEDFGQELMNAGFYVRLCRNLEASQIKSEVENYARFVKWEHKSAISVFYFAGHGATRENQSMVYGVDYLDDESLRAPVNLGELLKLLDPDAQHINLASIAIIDACSVPDRQVVGATPAMLFPLSASIGSYLVFSTAPGRAALDAPVTAHAKHSPFAEQLIVAVHASDATTEVDKLFRDVRKNVKLTTKGRQVPWTSHSLLGPVYLKDTRSSQEAS